MIGQYPGQIPKENSPTAEEVERHIKILLEDAGITLFCSL